jgi:membrane-associated protease RseP (regulator of RpoE activity)
VSDETPPAESPSDVPEIATPSEPTVEATVPETPVAEAPSAPEAPAAVEPTSAEPTGAEPTAGDGPTAEGPTETATPPVAPAPDPVPVELAPVAAASEPKRKGVFVPVWVGAVILVLAVAAGGFGIGRWTADDSSNRSTAIANNGGIVPQLPSGNANTGNGNSGSGNQTTPTTPSTGTAFLGVASQNGTDGVTILSVGANTPASKAGLQQGDVINAIDNTSVTTTTALRAAIQSHTVGDTVTIHYTRNGQASTVKVTLGTQSQ